MSKKEEKKVKPEHQKLMNEDGKVVDYLEKLYDIEYYRIETDTHFINRMQSTILKKKDDVEKLFGKSMYKAAHQIAQGFVRSATRAKPVYKKMSNEEYLSSLQRSWSLFMEKIFGYRELTKKQLTDDVSEVEGSTEKQ